MELCSLRECRISIQLVTRSIPHEITSSPIDQRPKSLDSSYSSRVSVPAGISIIINERSGLTGKPDAGSEIQALFTKAGVHVRLERVRAPEDIAARARQAASRGDLLIAAGGDGTINSVAAVAVERGSTLGVLPMGTLNHFAKDLRIPLDLESAVATIAAGHVQQVDVGEVNGRVFVNNSSVGLYPRMVWEREGEQRRGRKKWAAFMIAVGRTWRNYRMAVAHLDVDGKAAVVRTPFIFVGNNEYAAAGFQVGARAALDRGRLSVFVAPECGRFEILALPLRALTNRLAADEKFKCFLAQEVTIELSRHHVSVGLDGEVTVMRPPLHFRVRPAALHLFVPGRPPS
jgi:diacylglycerol kinase family enzyme